MKKNKEAYILMAPYMILFLIFVVIPVFSAIFLSFTYFNLLEAPQFRGFLNYIRLFLDDEVFLIAIKNTLIFAFLTGPLSYFLCLILAWFINELPSKVRSILVVVFYAPSISGNVFIIWSFIFSGDMYGLVNSFLLNWGFINEPFQWLMDPNYNIKVLIIVPIW